MFDAKNALDAPMHGAAQAAGKQRGPQSGLSGPEGLLQRLMPGEHGRRSGAVSGGPDVRIPDVRGPIERPHGDTSCCRRRAC
jgi:hypothetical protein